MPSPSPQKTASSRPTLRDIARDAGVAVTTASVVVRGDLSVVIRPETRQRILDAAQRLGYRRNLAASSLRSGKSNFIGLLVQALDVPMTLLKLREIDHAILARGYRALLRNTDGDPELEAQYLHEFADHLVAGLVLIQGGSAATSAGLVPLQERGVPILTLEPLPGGEVDCITVDRRFGAALAIRHLLELGHRRFVFLHGDLRTDLVRQRLAGYRETLTAGGIPVKHQLLWPADGQGFADGYRAASALLANGCQATAWFCNNDEVAIGAMRAIQEAGRRIPQDLSVVGFDDIPVAAYAPVPLTTIAQPVSDIAAATTERLFARISGKAVAGQPLMRRLEPRLMVRSSTGMAPVPDYIRHQTEAF